MKVLKAALIISALTGALAGRASARGVMYSAPSNDGLFYCGIRNTGTTQIVGKIEGVSFSGIAVDGPFAFTLDGGTATAYFVAGGATSCKVTLTKGLPRKVRGVVIYHAGTDGVYTIPIQ